MAATATTTEVQNNFGKYLQRVISGEDIIILKNGAEVARVGSNEKRVSFLTDSLAGILKNNYDDKKIRTERMTKYESVD